jgi:hypothetical protein
MQQVFMDVHEQRAVICAYQEVKGTFSNNTDGNLFPIDLPATTWVEQKEVKRLRKLIAGYHKQLSPGKEDRLKATWSNIEHRLKGQVRNSEVILKQLMAISPKNMKQFDANSIRYV